MITVWLERVQNVFCKYYNYSVSCYKLRESQSYDNLINLTEVLSIVLDELEVCYKQKEMLTMQLWVHPELSASRYSAGISSTSTPCLQFCFGYITVQWFAKNCDENCCNCLFLTWKYCLSFMRPSHTWCGYHWQIMELWSNCHMAHTGLEKCLKNGIFEKSFNFQILAVVLEKSLNFCLNKIKTITLCSVLAIYPSFCIFLQKKVKSK